MRKIAFRPGLWPTVSVLIMLPILLALGVWQCQRLVWKTALVARITAQMTQAPQPLPADIEQPNDWAFRQVTVTGVFDPVYVAAIPARVHNGVLGGKIIYLLRRAEGASVLVDRGWVPQAVLDDLKNDKNLPPKEVRSISGLVRLPEPGNIFTPENQPARGWWYRPDPHAMVDAEQMGPVMPFWLEQSMPEHNGDSGPMVLPSRATNLPNNHFGYAVTWFGLAGVLLVIYIIHGFKQAQSQGATRERPVTQSPDSGGL